MKGNVSSKKKIVIAASVVGVVLLAAIISVVAVLAAPTQTINSTINVSYVVEDVSATISSRYMRKGDAIKVATPVAPVEGETFEVLDLDGDAEKVKESVRFTPTDDSKGGVFQYEDVELKSNQEYVVFEFAFTNDSDKKLKVSLTSIPTVVNMTYTYCVSDTKSEDWASLVYTGVTGESLQADVTANASTTLTGATGEAGAEVKDSVYIYIKVQVTDLNKGATCGEGKDGFTWSLTNAG